MANFLQRLFDTGLETRYQTQLKEAAEVASNLSAQVMTRDLNEEILKESVRDLSLYLEDLNWIPVDGWEEGKGFSIETIKRESDRLQALLAVNPTIKKAINARVGYIHGRGVSFKGTSVKAIIEDARNAELIFSETAKWRLEAQLATDGNIWTARSKTSNELLNIPLNQIAGWVVDENDPTRVNYWLREYTYVVKNFSNGVETPKHIKVFYPAYGGNPKGTAKSIDGIPVDRSYEMVHLAANRQNGWVLGIPDIMAAMFWAKGHKELFEAGTAYVKAQGRFASKVTSKTQAGAQRTAAAVAGQPRRDEQTGEILDIGGTAVMSAGLDMQLMGKMSGGVDFKAFDPVAGLVAVGLDIPLEVILGTSDGEEKSLEQTTVNAMQERQKLWSWYFKALLAPKKIEVVWPKIKTEPTYRQIQSIGLSNEAATLSREELRFLTLEAYGLDGVASDVPDIEENAKYLMQKLLADNAAEHAQDAAESAAEITAQSQTDQVAKQGVTGSVGKLSTGKDAKASRDNKSDRNTKNT